MCGSSFGFDYKCSWCPNQIVWIIHGEHRTGLYLGILSWHSLARWLWLTKTLGSTFQGWRPWNTRVHFEEKARKEKAALGKPRYRLKTQWLVPYVFKVISHKKEPARERIYFPPQVPSNHYSTLLAWVQLFHILHRNEIYTVFVTLYVTHLTWHNVLQLHQCRQWYCDFLLLESLSSRLWVFAGQFPCPFICWSSTQVNSVSWPLWRVLQKTLEARHPSNVLITIPIRYLLHSDIA